MKRHEFIQRTDKGVPMNDEEFVHWLNGFFEITNCTEVGPEQTKIIKEKLQSMFIKETGKKQETNQNAALVFNPIISGIQNGFFNNAIHRDGLAGTIFGDNSNSATGMPPIGTATVATVGPAMVIHTC